MEIRDKQIIALLKNKKTLNAGFKMLMDAYQQRLYHHIRSIVGNHEDADDILQNTFVKVFKNIKNFEERSQLFTWLYRIATNEATTYINRNARKIRVINNEEAGDFINVLKAEQSTNGDMIKEILQNALNELPPKQKAIFSLRYFEELTYNEISEIMGTTVGALKASYHHAVKKIENYIKQVEVYH